MSNEDIYYYLLPTYSFLLLLRSCILQRVKNRPSDQLAREMYNVANHTHPVLLRSFLALYPYN